MGFAVIGAVMLDLTFAKGTRLEPLKPVRRHRRALANVSPVSVPDGGDHAPPGNKIGSTGVALNGLCPVEGLLRDKTRPRRIPPLSTAESMM